MSYRNYIQMGAIASLGKGSSGREEANDEASSSSSCFYDDMIKDLRKEKIPKKKMNHAKYIESDSSSDYEP